MKRAGLCTTIALYNLDYNHIDIKDLFSYFEKWFEGNGYIPLRASIDAEGVSHKTTKTFKTIKKLIGQIDAHLVKSFWFGAYGHEHTDDEFDAILSVGLNLQKIRGEFYVYYHNDILSFKREYVENLIIELSNFIQADYGVVFNREFYKGPGCYVSGIITGLSDRIPEQAAEADKIGAWWRSYSFDDGGYVLGQLRDIYPMNLLSEAHLKQPVFNTTLQKWIESSAEHGELKPLTDTLWEWWVPEDKIESIREALRETRIIICI
jgi:hypothetical protein